MLGNEYNITARSWPISIVLYRLALAAENRHGTDALMESTQHRNRRSLERVSEIARIRIYFFFIFDFHFDQPSCSISAYPTLFTRFIGGPAAFPLFNSLSNILRFLLPLLLTTLLSRPSSLFSHSLSPIVFRSRATVPMARAMQGQSWRMIQSARNTGNTSLRRT